MRYVVKSCDPHVSLANPLLSKILEEASSMRKLQSQLLVSLICMFNSVLTLHPICGVHESCQALQDLNTNFWIRYLLYYVLRPALANVLEAQYNLHWHWPPTCINSTELSNVSMK